MLNKTELSTLVKLRTRLLHYWQKFPEPGEDRAVLNDWQNILDTLILQERKRLEYSGGTNGN